MATELLRRLRGTIGTAFVWAVLWLPLGVLLVLYRNSQSVECFACARTSFVLAIWTGWGALNGAVFAALLMITERRNSFTDLSMRRFGLWGALVAVSVPAAITVWDVTSYAGPYPEWGFATVAMILSALLGAGCACRHFGIGRVVRQSDSFTRAV